MTRYGYPSWAGPALALGVMAVLLAGMTSSRAMWDGSVLLALAHLQVQGGYAAALCAATAAAAWVVRDRRSIAGSDLLTSRSPAFICVSRALAWGAWAAAGSLGAAALVIATVAPSSTGTRLGLVNVLTLVCAVSGGVAAGTLGGMLLRRWFTPVLVGLAVVMLAYVGGDHLPAVRHFVIVTGNHFLWEEPRAGVAVLKVVWVGVLFVSVAAVATLRVDGPTRAFVAWSSAAVLAGAGVAAGFFAAGPEAASLSHADDAVVCDDDGVTVCMWDDHVATLAAVSRAVRAGQEITGSLPGDVLRYEEAGMHPDGTLHYGYGILNIESGRVDRAMVIDTLTLQWQAWVNELCDVPVDESWEIDAVRESLTEPLTHAFEGRELDLAAARAAFEKSAACAP